MYSPHEGYLIRCKRANPVRLAPRLDARVHWIDGQNSHHVNKCSIQCSPPGRSGSGSHRIEAFAPDKKGADREYIYSGGSLTWCMRCIFGGSFRCSFGDIFGCIFQVAFEEREQGLERVPVRGAPFEPDGLDIVRSQHSSELFGV